MDANEAWRPSNVEANLAACLAAGVALIEQPLPAGEDDLLAAIPHPVPVCADESLHDRAGLDALAGRYDAINIKLDKTGGLTEAVMLANEARARGLTVMVGCMLGTSLGMAPATLLTGGAAFIDLDGPLLLARDREPPLATRAAPSSRPTRPVGIAAHRRPVPSLGDVEEVPAGAVIDLHDPQIGIEADLAGEPFLHVEGRGAREHGGEAPLAEIVGLGHQRLGRRAVEVGGAVEADPPSRRSPPPPPRRDAGARREW